MEWQDYENQIFKYLKQQYPDTSIFYDEKIKGKNSKHGRQIDILIESYVAGKRIRIVVDTKYFKNKIDVKDVEAFISMVQDVDAQQGILVTNIGYTQAAINRAYYGPTDIELDILNFDELKKFQAHGAILHSGPFGAIIPAPFGWIVDGDRKDDVLATLYQRGIDFQTAARNKEWMYVNIFRKENHITALKELIKLQELATKAHSPDAKFEYDRSIERSDKAKTALRTITIDSYPTSEYTGFIEFDKFFLFFVLFSPIELRGKNIRKLETLLQRALPLNVDNESAFFRKLKILEDNFLELTGEIEKAASLIDQGDILFDLKKYEDADKKYTESISFLPTSYGAFKGRLKISLITNLTNEDNYPILTDLIKLEPKNPTIASDIIDLYRMTNRLKDIPAAFNYAISKYPNDKEAVGNFNFHLGSYMMLIGNKKESKRYFNISKKMFEKCLPNNHQAFEAINDNIRILNRI